MAKLVYYAIKVGQFFCIGFLNKVVRKIGRLSVFVLTISFPFNFRTANALVLKFNTPPLSCRFSNMLLAIFDIVVCSRVIHRFVQIDQI